MEFSNIIFVRTTQNFESYFDLYELAISSGFSVIYFNDIDYDKHCSYIISPIDISIINNKKITFSMPKKRKCKIIYWYLERYGIPDRVITEFSDIDILYESSFIDLVWVSDYNLLIDMRKKIKHKEIVYYMTLGSSTSAYPHLYSSTEKKEYDLCCLLAPYGRRSKFFSDVNKYSVCPNSNGIERNGYLAKSKMMVSVHRDELTFSEPFRFAIASAYKMCYLCESTTENYPLIKGIHYDTFAYNPVGDNSDMTNKIEYYLCHEKEREAMGNNLFNLLCGNFSFDKNIKNFKYF